MMNKIRDIFFPTQEQMRSQKQILESILKVAISEKHCIVCKHYSYDANVPGFVTYEGDCDLGMAPSFGKPKKPCENFELLKKPFEYFELEVPDEDIL